MHLFMYTKTLTPNQCHMETTLPAIQAEQVEFDVAPVAAEYVPAKTSDEEYAYVNSNTGIQVHTRNKKARR
jgi:hypothetical protein